MKNRAAQILALGITLTAVAAVYARTKIMTADVPFSFHVSSMVMPQGVYTVSETTDGAIAWIKPIQEQSAKAVATMNVVANHRIQAMLVFHRVGQEYFLAEIWAGDGSTGRALPPATLEKELTRNGAATSLAVVRVALHR